jgi:hypothetical protein
MIPSNLYKEDNASLSAYIIYKKSLLGKANLIYFFQHDSFVGIFYQIEKFKRSFQ